MATIFLQENKAKVSTNTTTFVSGNLSRKEKALQGSNVMENFSLFGQYNAERDACGKFRMIFAINPVCSNTIFNVKTEVIKGEGSTDTRVVSTETERDAVTPRAFFGPEVAQYLLLNYSWICRRQVIKDTEYSNPSNGNLTYHCGIDIFNNHLLRSRGFTHINPSRSANDVFNTLNDYRRDAEGRVITVASPEGGVYDGTHGETSHIYYAENLMSLREAFGAHLKEIDGWVGFTNPGTLDAPNYIVDMDTGQKVSTVNRMFMNKKPCEFIDMYPDRSLYSFVPKYNESRKRAEKNWDYCITYPYEKDYELVDTVLGGEQGTIGADIHSGTNVSSVPVVICRSMFKHTLTSSDSVYIYYYKTVENEKVFTKYPMPVKILSVGDYRNAERDRYFSIRINDIPSIADEIINNGKIYYKKISHGSECEYYFRKYKKLKKKNPDGTETDLKSEINKIAYGENIYGDRMAQIIFTDDIDINGIYDHLGRPLSEVYLTIIKRNAGHQKWSEGEYGDEAVEYSHCFGKNTAGVDFGSWSGMQVDYNVRCLHNVSTATPLPSGPIDFTYEHLGDIVNDGIPKVIGDDITISADTFYGDVVEFDPYNYTETEISKVMFRFNTLQRETVYSTSAASVLFYHKLVHDDYDMDEHGDLCGFETKDDTETFNITMVDNGENTPVKKYIPANINPEGYFYNPHNRIKIREDAEETTTVKAKRINYVFNSKTISEGITKLNITAPVNYGFFNGDTIAFYRRPGEYGEDGYMEPKVLWGMISGATGVTLDIVFSGEPFSESVADADFTKTYPCFYSTESVPLYASFHPSTQSFIWRENVLPSEMTMDMELYNTPFSNGRFYIEKNIAFFLRRQDPFGEAGLSVPKFRSGNIVRNPMTNFNIYGEKIDLSSVYNFLNNIDYTCY